MTIDDGEEAQTYATVKTAILNAYSIVPEAYRQKFRNARKQNSQSFREFSKNKEIAFPVNVKSVDELRELVLLEDRYVNAAGKNSSLRNRIYAPKNKSTPSPSVESKQTEYGQNATNPERQYLAVRLRARFLRSLQFWDFIFVGFHLEYVFLDLILKIYHTIEVSKHSRLSFLDMFLQ